MTNVFSKMQVVHNIVSFETCFCFKLGNEQIRCVLSVNIDYSESSMDLDMAIAALI
jgi:hypothetical protein